MNAGGQVVGSSTTAGNRLSRAYSWTRTGGMVDLGALGGDYSEAFAVNGRGDVVGTAQTGGLGEFHATLWRT